MWWDLRLDQTMKAEQIVLPLVSAIGKRPRLSNALFKYAKWGNPFAEERFSYPYELYDRYRADGEVFFHKAFRQWFVFGYDEVLEVLHSSEARTSAARDLLLSVSPYTKLSPQTKASFSRWLLVNDPPDHTRLRASVSRAFTPKRISSWEPMITEVARELLDKVADQKSIDAYQSFTAPLPIYVIAAILGLPRDRWEWLRESSREIGLLLEAFTQFEPASMNRRFAELDSYFTELISDRRAVPADDLISVLAAAESGDALTNDEIVSMISFLMFAGHETTTGLLGNSIVALAKHPEQRALLRSQPDLIDNAVEELIRFDSPVQTSARNTVGEIKVGTQTIPSGATVAVFIGPANRDRRKWPDADQLRLDRPDPRPISFGHGLHFCLGAALARLETRIAIPAFLEAFGDYTVDTANTKWKQSHTLRGPIGLPVRRG